jgi:tetratricopeptide (TPR) repeat protein
MDQSAYELRIIGKMFLDRDDFDTGKVYLEGGVDLTMDRPDSLERAAILSELGECLFHLEQHSDAIICLEEAVKINKAKLGQCELLLDSQINLCNGYKKLSMNSEWLAVSKEVMFLTEKIHRGDEAKAASALFGVAEAYEVLGQNEEAISMFHECKELLKRALSKDHIDVAKVMQRLANIYEKMGNFESAYENNVRALDIAKANFESADPQLGEMYHRLGITCMKMQEYDKTRNHLQEALTIFKSNEMARETCLVLMALGDVYRLMRDADTALMCYERCFTFVHDIQEEPDIMGSLYLAFGHARLSKKLWSGAQECFEKGACSNQFIACS